MHPSTIAALVLSTAHLLSPTHAFQLTRYGGAQCRGAALGPWVGGPGQGCQSGTDALAGVGASVVVESTGPVDDNFYTVFFESDDCNPETEMADGHKDDGCFSGNYGSYAVWDVGS